MSETRPEPHTTTATQVAQWYAEQALYLYGRADRRGELHGERDTTRGHLLELAHAKVETAYVLQSLAEQLGEQAVAEVLAVAAADDSAGRARATRICVDSGGDPEQAHARGYAS